MDTSVALLSLVTRPLLAFQCCMYKVEKLGVAWGQGISASFFPPQIGGVQASRHHARARWDSPSFRNWLNSHVLVQQTMYQFPWNA